MRQKWTKGVATLTIGLVTALGGFTLASPSMADDTTSGAVATPLLKTKKDRISYSLGVETVKNYRRLGMDIDMDLVIRGMKDAAAGGKLELTEGDVDAIMITYRAEAMAKQRREKIIAGFDNKKEGEEFQAANKTKEGVVTLPSGLQYKVLKEGKGKIPTEKDTVEVNLKGTLVNGTEFENTFKTNQPLTFEMGNVRVVKGVRDALKLMPVGSRWQVVVPPSLAYLAYGRGKVIAPNSTLVYELELLTIK